MPFVLDASVTICWAFADESEAKARAALARLEKDSARAPSLWWYEVRNSLVMNERRKRITSADSNNFLRYLDRMEITLDHSPNEAEVLRLARDYKLSIYDASYLELAQRENASLATLDSALAAAARQMSVPLLGAS